MLSRPLGMAAKGRLAARWLSTDSRPEKILLTGACGQVGSELLPYLRGIYGTDNVIASDVRDPPADARTGPYERLDVTDADALESIRRTHEVSTIVHLAALLSATGEKNPQLALHINNLGVTNVLEAARVHNLRVFSPSTIAVFGPSTPRDDPTPDSTVMRPTTMYGVTKVHLELLGEYYHAKFGVDFRSLRYPGVVSAAAMPGGGTTDYAVEIYHEALACGRYTCFLDEDTVLPMIYMPDLLRGTVQLMQADSAKLTQRTYNIAGLSFTPKELAASISERIPNFSVEYAPDFRQQIAATWPQRLDDSAARRDWGWRHVYDMDGMTADMLAQLGPKVSAERSETIAEDIRLAAAKREEMMRFLKQAADDETVKV